MIDPSQRVAIVGIGGVFPGADDPDQLWTLIAAGRDATGDVPPGRWSLAPERAFDPRVGQPDRVYSTRGGFVDDPGLDLDALGLDLDPALVSRLDPMFRLALRAGAAAWRDARTDQVDRRRVPVIFGNLILPTDTTSALTRATLVRTLAEQVLGPDAFDSPDVEPLNRFAAGLPASVLAQALGLGGGAYTLDAACASSLYALKLAADALRSGRADAVLTGGLSRPDPLYTQMGFSQLRALSPSMTARPFDARGDGLVVGEGCGLFVLKRLDDALRHGDRIYGLLAGVGLSNDVDGGLLAPSSEGQLRAMRAAYAAAGWAPQDVDLIECHATGTPVGDAVEFASLRALWGDQTGLSARPVVGSHKGNIGHSLTASGAAGLIKLLKSLEHETLPPTANFAAPGGKIDLDPSPFRILDRAEPWPRRVDGRPRRAAISGFGFGGINAHVLIEEWLPETATGAATTSTAPASQPPEIAIVGLGAHVGPDRGLRAVQERLFGGRSVSPETPGNGWGLLKADWARREGLSEAVAAGAHVDRLEVPLKRFRIPPRELEEMLPQQTLALLAAADAVADAATLAEATRLRTGVLFGIALDPNTTNFHARWAVEQAAPEWAERLGVDAEGPAFEDWSRALREAAGPALSANRTMGALGGLIASRIAREFRLGGPSFTVSSEETSGLDALQIATRWLQQGDLDAAVVGAVDLAGDPRLALAAQRAGIPPLPRADAAVALVLKRADDAIRDGDRIYALVGELTSSLAGPLDGGEPIASTPAPLDARPWHAVSERRAAATPRGAIPHGHAGAAEGLLQLVRGVVALYQQIVPAGEGTETGSLPSFWLRERADGPRRLELGARSVGGNALHAELVEFDGNDAMEGRVVVERRAPRGARSRAVFAVEGVDAAALRDGVERLDALAATADDAPIERLAGRWLREAPPRPELDHALAFTAGSAAEVRERLTWARARLDESGAKPPARDGRVFASGPRPLGRLGTLALVYPGIGNPITESGSDFSVEWPEVFRGLDRGTSRLRSQLAPAGWYGDVAPPIDGDQRPLILGQIVKGMAMTDLLATVGVRPRAVVGYSLGESAALFATRTWQDRDEMHERLDASPLFATEVAGPCHAARRAWGLRPDEPVDWTAALVAAPVAAIRDVIASERLDRVYPLIVNADGETVVGGQRPSVERLLQTLGAAAFPLPTVSTVHCPIAREVESAYRAMHLLATTPPPGVTVYSAGWGRSYPPTRETAAEAVVAQALDTVDFPRVVRRAYADGVRLFVEAGPGASCSRLIRSILAGQPHLARPASTSVDDFLDLLARLIAERVPVDLGALYDVPTRALGLDETPAPPNRGTVAIVVGGPPLQAPPAPQSTRPIDPQPTSPAPMPPITPESLSRPITAEVLPAVSRPSPTSTLPTPLPVSAVAPAAWSHVAPADPLVAQVVATSAAEADAHAAYLRISADLGQTMANHMAFQMALVEALMTAPAAASAPIEPFTPANGHYDDHGTPAVAPEPPAYRNGHADPRSVPPVEPPRALDRAQCLAYAVGKIGDVLGPKFAAADAYPTRVRLPDEPLMLVDRIVAIEGEPLSMTHGRVVTEHDVRPGNWYLDGGRIPTGIAVESGQADLFLSGWLGIDFQTRGEAVYRLLDAVVTFHGPLPQPGDVIRYDITVSGFFRQGDTYLFRFQFDGTVDGRPLITMRDGCAGFFSEAELAAGKGIIRRALDLRPLPGKRPADWVELTPMGVESYDDARVEALRRGDLAAAFGPAFAGLDLADPVRLPGGKLALLHRVETLDPTGGRHGLGLIRSQLDIHPDDWFLTCHFVDDRVMPGTLMYECCLHALRVYLMRMGWIGEASDVAYEPVPGVSSRLRCRGQVIESTKQAVFEVVIKELGYGPEPYAIADAMMYADGRAVVEVVDMSVRLSGLTRDGIEALWRDRPRAERPALVNDRAQILAFAEGKPSEAFGPRYAAFDEGRFIARLPRPPYSFLDRVVSVAGEPCVMKAGSEVVADYDVPPGEWYFAAERVGVMPFAVLLEISLQPCGWLAAYMGAAFTSDEPLAFRNLGGEAVVLAEITPNTGTLTTRVRTTRVSHSGGMIIEHFEFETSAGGVPVYRGSTYFGFFRREALADQVGIREASPYSPTADELARGRSFDYPAAPPFPDDTLRMIDRVEAFVPDGGPHGLGFIRGTMAVDPERWFFRAHFHQDPVCPGSLGLESFLQLLKVVACERWGGEAAGGFESVARGETHRWVYRGQIVPADRLVTVEAVVTAFDDDRRQVTADGFLSVDGRIIYQMIGFAVRLRAAAL